MRRGLGVMRCYLVVSSHFRLPSRIYVNKCVAIDTNILSSVDKEHFDEDTYSRLQ